MDNPERLETLDIQDSTNKRKSTTQRRTLHVRRLAT